jgi:Icc protein
VSDLVFIHLSDLHLTDTPGERVDLESGPEISDPDRYLGRVIAEIRGIATKPACIIISGDLVNAPTVAAYQRARAAMVELEQIAPVLLGLGNHDDRALFRQVVLSSESDDPTAPYFYATTIDGLRIIMLDSTVPGEIGGEIGSAQLTWLAAQLRDPAPRGTVVVLHHAVVQTFAVPNSIWQDQWGLADAAALEQVIADADVLGLLSGHVHVNSLTTFGGTTAATVTSMISMIDPTQVAGTLKAGAGFNVCVVRDGRLIVNSVSVA